jgi:hypothetical protein
MLERWNTVTTWQMSVNTVPYLLFYIGIGLHYGAVNNHFLFSAARYVDLFFSLVLYSVLHRIILAIDLELFYLISLRFLSAFEFFGPKLVMIQKMVTNSRLFCDVNCMVYSKHLDA